jgi:cyclase
MRHSAVALCALAFFATRPAVAQDRDFSKVEIKTTRVAGSVYVLEGAGGNIGVSVGDDGIVVVDSQFAPLAAKIEAALKTVTDKPVRFLLNTHFHGDHTGGNAPIAARGAEIVAHDNVRKRMAAGGKNAFGTFEASEKGALPVVTFNDQLSVHLNGEEVRAIHVPSAHTDGDALIFFTQSNVLHMGDTFFAGRFPFIDVMNGGQVQGVIGAAKKVLADLPDDVKIIPGHGALSTKAELRTYLAMLEDSVALVNAEMDKKQTLDQIKAKNLFAAKYAAEGSGFIKPDIWAEIVYQSLSNAATGPKNDHGHSRN